MNRLMKRLIYILGLVAVVVLPSCKTDNWLDWKTENTAWLKQNATQTDIRTSPSGLQYKVLREGISTQMRPDDLKTVVVNYSGALITGNVFDSGTGKALPVSNLIKGFAEGVKMMTPPAHYVFYIPYDLGYGEDGTGSEGVMGYIPPYSTLVFDVELLEVY